MILKVKDENGQFKEVVLKGLKGDKGDPADQEEINKIKESLDNIKNKVQEWANVKSFGADDKGESDCSEIIQTCLENYDVVYIPSGTYRIDKTIILPFNKVLIGDISQKTVLIGTMSKEYMIQYGEDYNYNGYRGRIENIRFTSKNKINEKPYGVYANSGVLIKNCDFYSIGKVFDRNYNYIDMIKLEGVYCGYCVPNGDYLIKISGNSDALEINQLKIAMFDGDNTEFNGIYINRCHGGSITNSIPNCFITIENVNGFSIDNSHIEGDENYLIIKDSHVTFNNCFKFKNESVHDFNILSTNYDKTTSVIFNNFNFYLPAERVNRFKKYVEEIAPLTNNTIVKMNNCFRVENMADKNRTTLNTNGVLIKDLEEFNINSNAFSTSCAIRNLNVDSVISKIGVNYNVSLGSGDVSNLIGWQGVKRDTILYRAINVVDETRKIITSYSKYITVNNVTDNGVSIVLSANMVSNNGLLYLYRGSDNSSYNEVCKIPIVSRCILMDNGISVNGFPWESTPTTTVINDYNKVTSYEKNGDNVIIETSSTPILGTWKKGDKVINTNITSGQPIGWVYDGTTWVSYGQYI